MGPKLKCVSKFESWRIKNRESDNDNLEYPLRSPIDFYSWGTCPLSSPPVSPLTQLCQLNRLLHFILANTKFTFFMFILEGALQLSLHELPQPLIATSSAPVEMWNGRLGSEIGTCTMQKCCKLKHNLCKGLTHASISRAERRGERKRV
jgi:hypothetical protein